MIDCPKLCACIGPMYGEPHCSCTMVRLGLERSDEYKKSIEKISNIEYDISKVLEDILKENNAIFNADN